MKKWQKIMQSLRRRRDPAGSRDPVDRLAHAPEGLRVYAVGDIHGRADLLRETFLSIDRDMQERPCSQGVEVYLGDYIDRGSDSRGVIAALLARKQQRELVCLTGNHEWFLHQFFQTPELLLDWQRYGARETLLSYGVRVPHPLEDHHCQELAAQTRAAIPESHLQFLISLPLTYTAGDYLFVHAGILPGIPLDEQEPQHLLWIRDEFLFWPGRYEKVVVHGHTPVEEPTFQPDRINIDTGAYMTGRLTCLVLEGHERRLLRPDRTASPSVPHPAPTA